MAENRYNYGSTALKEDPKTETTPTLQAGKRRAARHWKDLQKESRGKQVMESGRERIAWPLRKLNERERNYIFESEKTMRFLDLLYGAVLFAFLIYVSDFFTMKMRLLTDLSWISIIVFGAIGFFNVLHIIKKHDRILWAVKENCDVSDGTVLFKRFLFFGKQSSKATGVANVYCTPTTGNTKIYRPFPIRLGQFGLFPYKSNAVILWIEGTGNPSQALAVKMRY